MEILYIGDRPDNIEQDYKSQLISLVTKGGQVKTHFVERGIANALALAMLVVDGRVIASCCLKKPVANYRNVVFKSASAKEAPNIYLYELGYIITHPNYEGKGFCSRLLSQFFPTFSTLHIYATTRKPAMAHILGKYGFYRAGKTYKEDLELLLYDGHQEPSL